MPRDLVNWPSVGNERTAVVFPWGDVPAFEAEYQIEALGIVLEEIFA